jgi:hypothetical protein
LPPSSSDRRVQVLREAARRRVEEVGLREAAEEVGMSFSGLRTFLRGTDPRSTTVRKLSDWYARRASPDEHELEEVRKLAELLTRRFAGAAREEAADQLVQHIRLWLAGWCDSTNTPPPVWLADPRAKPRNA